jgi:hypothetical protein
MRRQGCVEWAHSHSYKVWPMPSMLSIPVQIHEESGLTGQCKSPTSTSTGIFSRLFSSKPHNESAEPEDPALARRAAAIKYAVSTTDRTHKILVYSKTSFDTFNREMKARYQSSIDDYFQRMGVGKLCWSYRFIGCPPTIHHGKAGKGREECLPLTEADWPLAKARMVKWEDVRIEFVFCIRPLDAEAVEEYPCHDPPPYSCSVQDLPSYSMTERRLDSVQEEPVMSGGLETTVTSTPVQENEEDEWVWETFDVAE